MSSSVTCLLLAVFMLKGNGYLLCGVDLIKIKAIKKIRF
jgi:hypothetical protein